MALNEEDWNNVVNSNDIDEAVHHNGKNNP